MYEQQSTNQLAAVAFIHLLGVRVDKKWRRPIFVLFEFLWRTITSPLFIFPFLFINLSKVNLNTCAFYFILLLLSYFYFNANYIKTTFFFPFIKFVAKKECHVTWLLSLGVDVKYVFITVNLGGKKEITATNAWCKYNTEIIYFVW